jgi:5-oxoprolinase (ATP-hydrolysing)
VVAAARVAARAGILPAIGFDMGGTSTDVCCLEDRPERLYETEIAGVVLRAPMMAIHSIAAGGGSICRYTGTRFTVGPDSAGAVPGPLCYGRSGAGDLTLTDVNLFLGRLAGDRFPFPLAMEPVRAALVGIADRAGMTPTAAASGFLEVADADMAEAIRRVTVARGRDVREYALVVFGGAAGQHACPVARALGVRRLVVDRHAGVLSALGMGVAGIAWEGETDAGRHEVSPRLAAHVEPLFTALETRGLRVLAEDGCGGERVTLTRRLGLRLRGSDTVLTVDAMAEPADWERAFRREHVRHFGYDRPRDPIEATVVRVEATAEDDPLTEPVSATVVRGAPAPRDRRAFWTGTAFARAPVIHREDLAPGMEVEGPALILDATSTLALDPGWRATAREDGALVAVDAAATLPAADATARDPVRLTILNNLFHSIAAQMGETLRRTAISVNIRERRDYSCAVFDAEGGLVANAPHIPVHLGAMGESIRGVLAAHAEPPVGSVYATNDPAAGGSHLPDITVVTPVHDAGGRLLFFTASRGHHADVGGTTPGSMPPCSTRLEEEGIVFRALPIVREGRFEESLVRRVLSEARYPARRPDDNVADLAAQIAANRTGARLLEEAMGRLGRDTVLAYMGHAQANAAAEVEAALRGLGDGVHRFEDAMDDGTPLSVTLTIRDGRLRVDFTGTGPQSEGNLNAPRAVTTAAVLYVLRCLVGAPLPLNEGCLRPVTIHVPPGTLLSPGPLCAVAGGNVETSQRVVDALLGALGLAAASQGTMNNLSFGTRDTAYYETIAGGAGATSRRAGASGVQTHMTNTRITDPEVLESRFPVRLVEWALRAGSGGAGALRGGDGLVREFEALAPLEVTVLSERRSRAPFGLAGGEPGAAGRNLLNGREVGGKVSFHVEPEDRVRIETPGGGGFGAMDHPGRRGS